MNEEFDLDIEHESYGELSFLREEEPAFDNVEPHYIDLSEEELAELFRNGEKYLYDFYHIERYGKVYFRIEDGYSPTLEDFKALLLSYIKPLSLSEGEEEGESHNEGINLRGFFNADICGVPLFDYLEQFDPAEDPSLEEEESLICEIVKGSDEHENLDSLTKLYNFISEWEENVGKPLLERVYSDYSLLRIVTRLFAENVKFSADLREFCIKSCLYLGEKGYASALRGLGFLYYEGAEGFPQDQPESVDLFERSFALEQDPSVANVLGYIYYYGKTKDGKADGDKAFRYFSFGDIFGLVESTYKLADCYTHGYGGLQSDKAAAELLFSILDNQFDAFLRASPSKCADVFSRIARYYQEGKGVEKDPRAAYFYHLLSREAIKQRMEKVDYIGDFYVARRIKDNIKSCKALLEEVGESVSPTRTIKNGFYSLSSCGFLLSDVKFKTSFNPILKMAEITITRSSESSALLLFAPTIDYCRRKNCLTLFLKLEYDEALTGISSFVGKEGLTMEFFADGFLEIRETDGDYAAFHYLDIYLDEDSFPRIDRSYALVSATFEGNEKEYDYLCREEDIEVGETVIEERNGKELTVKSVDLLYFDQLPYDVDKLCYCHRK